MGQLIVCFRESENTGGADGCFKEEDDALSFGSVEFEGFERHLKWRRLGPSGPWTEVSLAFG